MAALSLLADEATTCLTERSATRLQQLIDTKGLVEALQKQQRQRWQSGRSKKQTAKQHDKQRGGADEVTDSQAPWMQRGASPPHRHIVGLDFGKVISGGANDEIKNCSTPGGFCRGCRECKVRGSDAEGAGDGHPRRRRVLHALRSSFGYRHAKAKE